MKLSKSLLTAGFGSLALSATPGLAQVHTAFIVPAGQAGNQQYGGSLGHEFDTVSGITITTLGCFDDQSNGLKLPIKVQLFDRTKPATPIYEMDFPVDDPATPQREDGDLSGGSRFLALPTPLSLPAGFQGLIAASGYGVGESNGNAFGSTTQTWTRDDGGGLISFDGLISRYGTANVYPTGVDITNAYAAATFQYQLNGPLQAAAPLPAVTGGNGQVQLSWSAVPNAAKYRISRADSLAGPYAQTAEITTPNYTDTGLTNGAVYFYKLDSVTAAGVPSNSTAVYRGTPYQLAPNRHVAYFTPSNTSGNLTGTRSLGMDFDVQNAVIITRLGVFDSGSDGIRPDPGPDGADGTADDIPRVLTASLYNRADSAAPVVSLTFTTADPGTLLGGMRFKNLASPITLPLGFQGCIAVDGYGAGEQARDAFNSRSGAVWMLDSGNSSLLFTGTGRYSDTPGIFPETVDADLADAYAAGTFEFETTAALAPGKPVSRLSPGIEDGAATLVWDAVTAPAPAAKYNIYRNDGTETEPVFVLVGSTTTALTYRVTGLTNGQNYSFVVRAVSAANVESSPSDFLAASPEPLLPGVAYVVPEGTVGREAWAGSLGMDFNVINPVRITRLGAFDSGSDGLAQPITVVLYDRTKTATPLVTMVFPVDNPATPFREDGELIGGSRFLDLSSSITLPAGFQGTISAYGYGPNEHNGNTLKGNTGYTTFSGGALSFLGSGRYQGDGSYPTSVDGGPPNVYAAGTFQFEVNSTPLPFAPSPVLTGGNTQVRLSWTPVVHEVPAVSYRISRAASAAGPYSQIAEVTGTDYTDTGLTNGATYFYKLTAVAGGNVLSRESSALACSPYLLPAGRHIAYFTPGDLGGNAPETGPRGMDFDVQNQIIVNRLGVFDQDSDGIRPDPGADGLPGTADDVPRTLTASIYNRDDLTVKATLTFTSADPGTPVAGMRLKDLPAALTLPSGFHGTIVVDGYGPGEMFRNAGGAPSRAAWTLDAGNESILFTGTGRFSDIPGAFPDSIDTGLPDAYAAGTFEFQTTAATVPGKPLLRLVKVLDDAAVPLVWDAVTSPLPAVRYNIYRFFEANQTYTLAGTTSGTNYRVTGLTNGEPATFVVTSVSATGIEGLRSDPVTSIPEALAAGVAYMVPAGTSSTRTTGSALGLDFDVVNAVRVTQLGAFDNDGDGLRAPITVAIYDRATGQRVTPEVVFAVDNPATPQREDGNLVEGSRFLPLTQTVLLPDGFQGSVVAYGYNGAETYGTGAAGWTTFSGGSLLFVGVGRTGGVWGNYPTAPGAGPANRFAAGTFYFEPAGLIPTFDANLTIIPQAGNQVSISWTATPGAILQRSTDMKAGNWISVPAAVPGFRTTVTGREFFRLIKP